jgi:hypothetical protein
VTAELTARAVLAKASAFDPRFRKPDPLIVAAWTEALGDINFDLALAAVTEHYRTETDRTLMPGDVLAAVRRAAGGSSPAYRPMSEVVAEIEARVAADRTAIEP